MEYHVIDDEENVGLERVFKTQSKAMEKALRRPVDKHVVTEVGGEVNGVKKDESVIAEEEQEVQKARFMLRLVKI